MAEMAEATGQCYDMRLLTQWSADHVWGMCCRTAKGRVRLLGREEDVTTELLGQLHPARCPRLPSLRGALRAGSLPRQTNCL